METNCLYHSVCSEKVYLQWAIVTCYTFRSYMTTNQRLAATPICCYCLNLKKHCACLFYTGGYASIKNPNISVTYFHDLDIITFHFYNLSSWLIRFEPKIYLQIILQIRIIFSKSSHSTKFNMRSMQILPRTIDEV